MDFMKVLTKEELEVIKTQKGEKFYKKVVSLQKELVASELESKKQQIKKLREEISQIKLTLAK